MSLPGAVLPGDLSQDPTALIGESDMIDYQ
jgi:hypothetical protein